MATSKLLKIAIFSTLASLLVGGVGEIAHSQERSNICAFSDDAKPSLFVDPWASTSDAKVTRFGATENSDDVVIQNCKGIDSKYIALSIGNRESALASDSADIVFREDRGVNRCEISHLNKIHTSEITRTRDQLKTDRLRTLRSCVGLEVSGLAGQPVLVGKHPTCQWTNLGSNRFLGKGSTCTVKVQRSFAISVKPVILSECLSTSAWENGQLHSADLETVLQAVVAENESAEAVYQTVGIAKRRIVFASTAEQSPSDEESKIRFSKTFGIEAIPVNAELITERARDGATSFIAMSWHLKNLGQWFNSHTVPLAAEAELIESVPGGKPKTVMTWLAYSVGQTLVPADWAGLFTVNRAEIPDFAFKHGRRYRIRLRFLHPHDVPALIKADMEQNVPLFESTPTSFRTQQFPLLNLTKKVPAMGGFPTLGKGPNESQNAEQASTIERDILRYFRSLGVDSEFPRRYNKACDKTGCVNVERLTYVGESYFEFTADAVPGQIGSFKAVQIVAKSKMNFQQQPSTFESAEGAEVKCP
jgi:hypothetical protein